jgi:hypothetical protein
MSCKSLLLFAAISFAVCPPLKADDAVPFQAVELDALIERTAPAQSGSGDLLILLNKVRLEAEIVSLPAEKRSQYLLDTLRNFGVTPLPGVTRGMDIKSAAGKTLNVYMEDKAAEKAARELKPGQKITAYGYHIYSSRKHGPGILISGFKPHSRIAEWKKKLVQWLDASIK